MEYAFQEPDQACLGKETEAEAARLIQAASIVAGSEPCNDVDDACQTSAHASGSCDHIAVEPKSKGVDVSDRGPYTYGLSDGDGDLASDAAGDMAPGAACQRERAEPTVSSETDTFVFDCRKLNSIPKEEVQWVHDDLYQWRSFATRAVSKDDAYYKLAGQWLEQQYNDHRGPSTLRKSDN